MTTKRTSTDYLNGVPELLLLRLLSRRPMYGYELVQAIHQASGQALDFGEGCIYPILHRLEAKRILTSSRQTVNGRSRVVYRLTDKGHRRLEQSVAAWQQVVQAVTQVLEGEWHGQPATV